MKQLFSLIFLITVFVYMLLFPADTFEGAFNGLNLWFHTVIPTILPFSILSNLLVRTNCATYISRVLSPLLCKIFQVSADGCYAIFVGFLCGYPMGAKSISDLIKQGKISCEEGQYLLSFCNNTSPSFIMNYLVYQQLHAPKHLIPTMIILYSSPIFCSFLFRGYYKKNIDYISPDHKSQHKIKLTFSLIDEVIMNSFETVTIIGGYIILFSILCTLGPLFAFLEITNGIAMLKDSYILCLALTSYGGLCSVFQTSSMIQGSGLSIKKYHKEKLITAMVTSLFAYIYLLFIHS